jgi:hypothetical protein
MGLLNWICVSLLAYILASTGVSQNEMKLNPQACCSLNEDGFLY